MNEQAKQYQQLIAKSWADEDFKNQLLADPAATMKAEGIKLPEGVSVNAVEDTAQSFTLVVPAKPDNLSDEDLTDTAGGACFASVMTLCCI